jgi:hypothetical protein
VLLGRAHVLREPLLLGPVARLGELLDRGRDAAELLVAQRDVQQRADRRGVVLQRLVELGARLGEVRVEQALALGE